MKKNNNNNTLNEYFKGNDKITATLKAYETLYKSQGYTSKKVKENKNNKLKDNEEIELKDKNNKLKDNEEIEF